MKCIVCSQGVLEIVNSRKHPVELRVWRRRKCGRCGQLFTTKELPDYDRALSIQSGRGKSNRKPFERTTLLAQLFAAGGHLKKQPDLLWLADTIAAKAFVKAAENNFVISRADYHLIIKTVLEAYDRLLSANFEARNPA